MLTARLVAAATRVQTPLALAGLVMIILYAISSQILHMDIFANVGGSGTVQLLDGLLQKIFFLAMASLFVAGFAYIATLYFRHRLPSKKSNLELIDARLDTATSNYTSSETEAANIIRRRDSDQG